jgi:hypothetical protein
MRWGLSRRRTGKVKQHDLQGPVRQGFVYVESERYQHGQETAIAAAGDVAPWLRHMMRHVTVSDFPASWQAAARQATSTAAVPWTARRSHDSREDDTRFMRRLDRPSQIKLDELVEHFGVSKAEAIGQLIVQATA